MVLGGDEKRSGCLLVIKEVGLEECNDMVTPKIFFGFADTRDVDVDVRAGDLQRVGQVLQIGTFADSEENNHRGVFARKHVRMISIAR